jgi:hypothetical protein
MYENKAKRQMGIFIGVIALIFMIIPAVIIDANATRAKLDDRVVEKTVQTTDLLSLQLSKEQVESSSFEGRTGGSILGNVGYVQGSSEGKPVTYIYLRYRAENGDIIDRLIPRDNVRLRDDLEPNAAATVEIETTKHRKPTYEDIQKDPSLCYDTNFFYFHGEWDKREDRKALPAEQCGKHPGDKPGDWVEDSVKPTVIHVPKDSVIVTINPNMVPDGAKKG